jgi:putative flippase GtrA
VGGIPVAVSRLRGTVDVVYREMLKFGAVGAFAFIVDVGLFNILTTDLWFGAGAPPLDGHEKLAKVVSASTATVVAWLGNRYWSFRHRRQSSRSREFVTFVLMNVIAMGIAVGCLGVSHDLLGYTSKLADNISGNVIGIALGTLFRFWAYRTFVFTEFLDPEGRDRAEDPDAEPLPAPVDQPRLHVHPVPQGDVEHGPVEERPLAGAAATPAHGLQLRPDDDTPRRAAG